MSSWLDSRYWGIKYKKDKFFLFGRCDLCKKRKNLNKLEVYELYPSEYGYDGDETYYFHINCVKEILNDPEKYSHAKVDIALKIIEIIQAYKENEINNSNRENNRQRSIIKKAMKLDPDLKERILSS